MLYGEKMSNLLLICTSYFYPVSMLLNCINSCIAFRYTHVYPLLDTEWMSSLLN